MTQEFEPVQADDIIEGNVIRLPFTRSLLKVVRRTDVPVYSNGHVAEGEYKVRLALTRVPGPGSTRLTSHTFQPWSNMERVAVKE